jgi:hypothetical protein
MTGMELTIITGVILILFALQRAYVGRRTTETIECLETITNLLREIRDDAREHHTDVGNQLANLEHYFATAANTMNDIDMALHGDYSDYVDPSRKNLNCLKSIEKCLEERLHSLDSRLLDIHLALESDRAGER